MSEINLPLHPLVTFEMTEEEIQKLCYFYSLGLS